jgi:hypothetical protein
VVDTTQANDAGSTSSLGKWVDEKVNAASTCAKCFDPRVSVFYSRAVPAWSHAQRLSDRRVVRDVDDGLDPARLN